MQSSGSSLQRPPRPELKGVHPFLLPGRMKVAALFGGRDRFIVMTTRRCQSRAAPMLLSNTVMVDDGFNSKALVQRRPHVHESQHHPVIHLNPIHACPMRITTVQAGIMR